MNTVKVISFKTPDNLQLDGLLFLPENASKGYIMIHGLASNVFSRHEQLMDKVEAGAAALFFNNRGHGLVVGMKRLEPGTEKGDSYTTVGGAHEVFTECIHDIQGAVDFLKSQGVTEIELYGHSTGCQKSAYYLSQNPDKVVVRATLLCPMSDYAFAVKDLGQEKLNSISAKARQMIAEGREHELLPAEDWSEPCDAQRFISLYAPNGDEEIFSYAQPDKEPAIMKQIKVPLKVIIAEKDEYADRPAAAIAEWFEGVVPDGSEVNIIPNALHNLTPQE